MGWIRIVCSLVLAACGGRLDSTPPNGDSADGADRGGAPSLPNDAGSTAASIDDPGRAPFACGGSAAASAPVQVLQYPGGQDIALDPAYVYLTDDGERAVKRMPRGGGALETVATGSFYPFQIRVHDTRVCWLDHQTHDDGSTTTTIWCSSTASFAPTEVLDTGDTTGRVYSFDFDDRAVYFVFPPSIYRAPLDGSAAPALVATDDAPLQPFSPMSLRTQDGFLYWASISDDGHGSIRRCASGSIACTPEILATYPAQSGDSSHITKIQYVATTTEIATTATHIYWTASVDFHGDLYRMSLESGNVTHLASCEDMFPQNLAVDSSNVYWAATTAEYVENVWRLPLDGNPASQVATMTIGQIWPNVSALAATDDGALYTTIDYTTGTLWRVPSH